MESEGRGHLRGRLPNRRSDGAALITAEDLRHAMETAGRFAVPELEQLLNAQTAPQGEPATGRLPSPHESR